MLTKLLTLIALLSFATNSYGRITACLRFNTDSVYENEDDEPLLGKDIYKPYVDINFTHPAIRAVGYLKNVTISGTDDYVLEEFKIINPFYYQLFMLTIKNISIVGQYKLNGNIGDLFDIFGEGDIRMDLIGFKISAFATFPLINSTGICFGMDVNVGLDKEEGYFTHLMATDEMEDLLNRAINSMMPEIVSSIWDDMKTLDHDELEKDINDLINKKAIAKIVRSAVDYFSKSQL